MRKLNLILLLFPLAGSSFHPNVHTQGYWSPGVWEECRIFQTGSECGFGTQSRNVSCIGFPSSPPQVVKPILCSGLPKPDQERLCARRCSPDCQLGPWEAWGPCTCNRRAQARNVRGISKPEACAECADADSTRFRRVVVPPTGGGGSCSPKLQRRPCIPALCIKDREVRDVPVALPLYSEQEPIVYVGPWAECRPQQKYLNKRDVNSFSQNQPYRSNQQHYQVQDSYFSNPSNPAPVGAEPVFYPGPPGAHPPSPEDLPFFINSFDAKSQPKQWNSQNSVQGPGGSGGPGGPAGPGGPVWSWNSEPKAQISGPTNHHTIVFPPPKLSYPDSRRTHQQNINQNQPINMNSMNINLNMNQDEENGDSSVVSQGPVLGSRTREVLCRGPGGEVSPFKDCMDGSRATIVPANKQTCTVDLDCQVGEWSAWTQLDPKDCALEQGNAIREERRRDLLRFGAGAGKPCPHLIQRKIGNSTVVCRERFIWKVGSWSDCLIEEGLEEDQGRGEEGAGKGCGGGIRIRNATCLDTEAGKPAPPHLCTSKNQPFTHPLVERCSKPCEETCKVGSWSIWSSCQPDSCLSKPTGPVHGYQIRRREMINLRGDENSCPALEEVRSCSVSSCYHWVIQPKEECQLPVEATQPCGAGFMSQKVSCLRWDGSEVTDTSLCGPGTRPRERVECHVPCPNDCIVSGWSDWSVCPSLSCENLEMHPRIPLRQRNRTILAIAGKDGQDCPSSDSLVEMSACPETSRECDTVSWRPQGWGECQLQPGQVCGKGQQTRIVHCADTRDRRLPAWRCSRLKTRSRRRECQIVCPVNCEVSDWTDWSKCPDLCQKGSSEGGVLLMETQRRERIILEESQHGGDQCPPLVQVRPCPLLAGSCKQARWSPGSWTNCSLAPGLSCGEGLRTRSLSCIRSGLSLPLVECISTGQPTPTQVEACHIDCSGSCILSSWSAWSSCPTACGSTRSRQRHAIDESFCKNKSLETEETQLCPCDQFSARPVGPWSDCILQTRNTDEVGSIDHVMQVSPLRHENCGTGSRFRRMDCYDSRGNQVDSSWCGGKQYLDEPCTTLCPVDCKFSSWGPWGPCDSICGPGLKNRTAKVVEVVGEGGRPCPGPTVQYASCEYSCDNFVWVVGPWTPCTRGQHSCGRGSRQRSVRCAEKVQDSEIVVLDEFCDAVTRPDSLQNCEEPCPGQCVVGDWTEWSSCRDCSWGSRRTRTRSVLRQPAQTSLICPPVQESSNCMLNSTCWEYRWRLTPWTSCRPEGRATCGTGTITRGTQCIRSDGRPVSGRFCSTLPLPGEVSVSCSVECPLDCVLSSWSPWDESQCQCGLFLANITRTRRVLVSPTATGRPCQGGLKEQKPCPSTPCYIWDKPSWSPCQLQGATCGTGIQRRNISCVTKPGGTVVPDSLCQDKIGIDPSSGLIIGQLEDLSTVTSCYISCDTDCTVSSWSEWSSCTQDTCRPASSVGVQTRLRNVVQNSRGVHGKCTPHLSETRWCISAPCYKFHWLVLNGDVFCQRSDGVRVNSGCESSVVGCGSGCRSVRHASCQAGHCVCLPGYLPQFSAHPSPRLSACLDIHSNLTSQGLEVEERRKPENEVRLHYFPDGKVLTYWMFALISIGCIFFIFLTISIYILCKSTCKNDYTGPDIPNNRILLKHQDTPLPPLWQ